MSKHTPGPWKVIPVKTGYYIDSRCGPVADTMDFDDEYGSIESEANARLIAAAPDLLEAARALLDLAERHGWLHVAVNAARAAIAKAEGEEEQP